jgi:signal transduction histidine kinase
MPTDLVERLVEHRTLGAAPRSELVWIAERGGVRRLAAGDVLSGKAAGRVEGLFAVLSGRAAIHVDRGAGRHKLAEWRAGDVTGMLPYSRLVAPPADSVAQEDSEIFVLHRDHLPALIRECPELTTVLVHVMLDRARHFTSTALHDEKLVSLGKLAAGLAHELNNPASAVERSARLLSQSVASCERASRALGAARLDDAELAAADELRETCLAASPGVLSPIEAAAREEELADWLDAHRADAGLAETLGETDVSTSDLDRFAAAVRPEVLETALRWVAAGAAMRTLAAEIHEGATRVSTLVGAVKGFTRMDQIAAAQPVDVAQGLASTIAVLRAKAKSRSVSVSVEVEEGLPKVLGHAGELNQVWANLLDNALDAAAASGRVEVGARTACGKVVVSVADDGAGIPEDIRLKIFEPFFTTKPAGHGMGLGLDIVRRLVRQQDGEIEVDSTPGRTEFRVTLPVADAAGTAK